MPSAGVLRAQPEVAACARKQVGTSSVPGQLAPDGTLLLPSFAQSQLVREPLSTAHVRHEPADMPRPGVGSLRVCSEVSDQAHRVEVLQDHHSTLPSGRIFSSSHLLPSRSLCERLSARHLSMTGLQLRALRLLGSGNRLLRVFAVTFRSHPCLRFALEMMTERPALRRLGRGLVSLDVRAMLL